MADQSCIGCCLLWLQPRSRDIACHHHWCAAEDMARCKSRSSSIFWAEIHFTKHNYYINNHPDSYSWLLNSPCVALQAPLVLNEAQENESTSASVALQWIEKNENSTSICAEWRKNVTCILKMMIENIKSSRIMSNLNPVLYIS